MATIEVGIRIDKRTGVAFSGLEAVNQRLAAGLKIRELRPGAAIPTVSKVRGDLMSFELPQYTILVVFEGD